MLLLWRLHAFVSLRMIQPETRSCVTSFLRLGGCSCFPSWPNGLLPGRLGLS